MHILPIETENDDVMNNVNFTARIKTYFEVLFRCLMAYDHQIWKEGANGSASIKYGIAIENNVNYKPFKMSSSQCQKGSK